MSSRLELFTCYKTCKVCFSSHFLFPHLDIRAMKYSSGVFPFFPALGHLYFLNLAYKGAGKASLLFALETKAYFTVPHSGFLLQLSREQTQQGCNNSEKFTALKVNQSPSHPAVTVTGFNKAACYNFHCHAFSTGKFTLPQTRSNCVC